MEKLAIDVGGVLIEKRDLSGADTNFDVNDVKWIPGALEAVSTLKKSYDLYILSFCGRKTEMETRKALHDKIVEHIPEEKWIFTRQREHKVWEMQKHGIKTLVDDTFAIIKWVEEAGLQGIHFRGSKYSDWNKVVARLNVVQKWNASNSTKIEKEKKPIDVNSVDEFPPLGGSDIQHPTKYLYPDIGTWRKCRRMREWPKEFSADKGINLRTSMKKGHTISRVLVLQGQRFVGYIF
jgi:hypothetical protein